MFYRCLNSFWGYCKRTPDFVLDNGKTIETIMEKVEGKNTHISGKACKLDSKACGQFSTTHISKEE